MSDLEHIPIFAGNVIQFPTKKPNIQEKIEKLHVEVPNAIENQRHVESNVREVLKKIKAKHQNSPHLKYATLRRNYRPETSDIESIHYSVDGVIDPHRGLSKAAISNKNNQFAVAVAYKHKDDILKRLHENNTELSKLKCQNWSKASAPQYIHQIIGYEQSSIQNQQAFFNSLHKYANHSLVQQAIKDNPL